MQVGISSFTYGWNVGVPGNMPRYPITETGLVKEAVQMGVSCLQIGDNLPVHTFSEVRREVFKLLLEQNHFRIELGARGLTESHLKTYLDLCDFFRSPLLRFVIDGPDYHPPLSEITILIKNFLPELKKKNITLGIENHDRFQARELADLMQAAGSENVGICLDCVNSTGAGEGLEQVANTLAPFTVNLHIKDFIIRRLPHQMGFLTEGEIAGKGMMNLPWLLEKLAPFDRCQSAILEQWVPPETYLRQTCAKEKEWAKQSMDYVRPILKHKQTRR